MTTLILIALLNLPGCTSYLASCDTSNTKTSPIFAASSTSCDSLRFKVTDYIGGGKWQQAYDTAKKFIEQCYNDPYAPGMFQQFSAARQPLEALDTSLWLSAQLWLESVLYLNTTNPEYFCACVEAMQVGPPTDTGGLEQEWKDINKAGAIDQWLVQNTSCDTPLIEGLIEGSKASELEQWHNDTSLKLDTTIPPLSSLGLGLDTLFAKHLLYATVKGSQSEGILSSISAYPNPTGSGTVISFGISKEAYVKIELYDLLGHPIGSAGFESLFEPGNKAVPISLAGLQPGTYIARITTAYGEVQSVKIVKE